MIVHNKGKFVRHASDVMLLPGTNEISKNDWEKFADNPISEILINKGEIVCHEQDLTEMSVQDAVTLVKDTTSPKRLGGWKAQEDRKTVINAIDKQLNELSGDEESEEGGEA